MKALAILVALAMFLFSTNHTTNKNWQCEGCVAPSVHAPSK